MSVKIKILHPLLCYYPSQAGGTANSIYWINNSLDLKDFSSEIISTKLGLIEPISLKVFNNNHKAFFLNSRSFKYLYKNIKSLNRSKIIQFSSIFLSTNLIIILFALVKNKIVVVSPRGELYHSAISQKYFLKFFWLSIIQLFQKSINFHVTNNFEKELVQKKFPNSKSIVVIPNYIEMPKKLSLSINMSFVFVGRINPIKNIHLLISAISNIHKLYPNIKLNILGSARLDHELLYLNDLQLQIKESDLENVVFFKGHLQGDVKNEIIATSKALILPSKSENFGNVVLEALAQGTPVIASKNTPWKILNDYESGLWVGSNIKELTSAMIKILSLDKIEYNQMRKNAFELCKSKYDIKKNIKVWENYYKKLITYD